MVLDNLIYPLYKDFDKEFFKKTLNAYENGYRFLGNDAEKVYFIKSLLCLQMLEDYRSPLIDLSQNLIAETDISLINSLTKSRDFKLDYSWAVWTRDKILGKLAEDTLDRSFVLVGSQSEFDEFIYRYLISIWLVDWEGPLYLLLNEIQSGEINLRELNSIMKLWDFTNIFKK